jgi:cobalt/nickel transport system permease protein
VVQALVFQDGGVLALGANVFNMAVAGVFAGYLPYRLLLRAGGRGVAVFTGACLSVVASALLAIGQLQLSGIRIPTAILGVSVGLFIVNGLVEGVITLGVVRSLEALHPGWIRKPPGTTRRSVLAVVAASALLLAVGGVWIASSEPDGLEKLAEKAGIASRARALLPAPLGDYETGLVSTPWLSKTAAGVAGLVLVFGLAVWIGRMQARRRED